MIWHDNKGLPRIPFKCYFDSSVLLNHDIGMLSASNFISNVKCHISLDTAICLHTSQTEHFIFSHRDSRKSPKIDIYCLKPDKSLFDCNWTLNRNK